MPLDDWTRIVVILMKVGEIANKKLEGRREREGEREGQAVLEDVHPPYKRADRDVSSSKVDVVDFFSAFSLNNHGKTSEPTKAK